MRACIDMSLPFSLLEGGERGTPGYDESPVTAGMIWSLLKLVHAELTLESLLKITPSFSRHDLEKVKVL